MVGSAGSRFHFVPDAEMCATGGGTRTSSLNASAGAPPKAAHAHASRTAVAAHDKENAPVGTPVVSTPNMERVQATPSSIPRSGSSSAPSPMHARWAQKSNDELYAKHAQLVALRHTSMLQRAALACGDDGVDDSPEFLKLQERSCTTRIVEIEETLRLRSAPIPTSSSASSSGAERPGSVHATPPSSWDVGISSGGSTSDAGTASRAVGRRSSSPNAGVDDASVASEVPPATRTPPAAPSLPVRASPVRAPLRETQPMADTDEIEIVETRCVRAKSAAPAAAATVAAAAVSAATPARTYAWDAQVQHALRRLFRLAHFRPDQLEAINATLSGRDVFCLMPTGGGKSLCYQLPATVTQGRTDGLTVVVSPLIALIHNQVKNLLRLEIPTLAITGDMSDEDRRFASAELYKRDLHVRLLYVTPEFVCNSRLAANLLAHLYAHGRLARFVIDEAHCVDQWGHDFRPDYVRLEMLRQQYPRVPLMALTATARIDTVHDIQQRLGMRDAVVLRQSFNRPNLSYSVQPKRRGAGTLESIAAFIKERHAGECGIIYCLSRRDCENVASDLNTKFGIQARHFHAGLDTQDKLRIQDTWEAGHFKVIVATIAFGMGIDKADVRFVIHHSIPKSLEGYYQETGRAGRDGKASECVLYWTMDDARKLEGMIRESDDASPQQKQHQLETLRQVTTFCQALTECRRTNILKYFGEQFDPADCHASCDNCRRGAVHKVDVTTPAKDFVNMVQLIGGRTTHLTRAYYTSVFKGSMRKDIKDKGHHRNLYHGRGAHFSDEELKRIVDHLLNVQYLEEYAKKAAYQRFPSHYVRVGPAARTLLQGHAQVELEMPDTGARATTRAPPAARRDVSASPEADDAFDLASIPLSPTELALLDAPASPKRRRTSPQRRPLAASAPVARTGPTARSASTSVRGGGRGGPSGGGPRVAIAPMPMGFLRRS
ncbi:hypothetical protein CBS9595_002078 [Malassezia furfur]|nr:hypothetical protein CBS9595_002078 [Malassezia furfur]